MRVQTTDTNVDSPLCASPLHPFILNATDVELMHYPRTRESSRTALTHQILVSTLGAVVPRSHTTPRALTPPPTGTHPIH